jgi:hypothetical protein
MEVETLGVARSLGWKVHMRCANGYRQETRSMRRCVYRKQLDRAEVYLQATVGLTDISDLSTCYRLDKAFIWQMSVKRFSTA